MSTRTHAPLVTIVVVTRDRLALLEETIGAIRALTYPNLELIVVDDASTDGTHQWLLAQADVTTIHFDTNVERSKARNAGIERASGEFLLVHDDDDLLEPRAIDEFVGALQRQPEAVAAISGYRVFDGRGNSARASHPRRKLTLDLWPDFLTGWFAHQGRTLFRAGVLKELGGYAIDPPHEDRELWLRVSRRGPVVVLPDVLMHYRSHHGQDHPWSTLQDVYDAHVATLPPGDAGRARRLVVAALHLDTSRRAYDADHPAAALGHALATIREAPSILTSPIQRPRVLSMIGKSAVGIAIRPAGLRATRRLLSRFRDALKRNPTKWRH